MDDYAQHQLSCGLIQMYSISRKCYIWVDPAADDVDEDNDEET